MKTFFCTLALTVWALPVLAGERSFDLGFAQPGMDQADFRDSHFDGGGRVICSNDSDLPGGLDLHPPKGAARAGAVRCGFYDQDQSTHWHPAPVTISGWQSEVWAVFVPDEKGTRRLAQVKLVLPEAAFDDLAQSWDRMLGLPSFRRGQTVHWSTERSDASIIGDGSGHVNAYLLDNGLHTSANRRLGQMPSRH